MMDSLEHVLEIMPDDSNTKTEMIQLAERVVIYNQRINDIVHELEN